MAESEKNTNEITTDDEEAKKRATGDADGGTGDADGGNDGAPDEPQKKLPFKKKAPAVSHAYAASSSPAPAPAPTATGTVLVEEPVESVELGHDGDNHVIDFS